ncbi:cbb3-type cytochrome c oxidase subunit I [Virgibacillus sp. L01]|uniref:cbb3-type cytochrome c oxidase subunit I n=1 Tax=Virgibacillus sp. L01 TaxID=3457429 RepID=UPI003FD55747
MKSQRKMRHPVLLLQVVDATIVVNHVMHNTKWVPGHFHMYMALGACAMIFGFMYFLAKEDSAIKTNIMDKIAFIAFSLSIVGLGGSFLVSGALSTPRRWATHIPEWMGPAVFGAFAGVFAILSVTVFVIHFIRYINKRNKVGSSRDLKDKKLA